MEKQKIRNPIKYDYILPEVTVLLIEPNRLFIKQYEIQRIHVEDDSITDTDEDTQYFGVEYYYPKDSDKYRIFNTDFRKISSATEKNQMITVTRTDGSDPDNIRLSIHAIPLIDSNEPQKSNYTLLTLGVGQTIDGKRINFYVNPKHIAESMTYSRHPNNVNWADIPKYEFDKFQKYEECVDFLIKRNIFLQSKANNLLRESYRQNKFSPNFFYPVMVLGRGGFGAVILALERLNNLVNTMTPYVLKFQRIPEKDYKHYEILKRGALFEPYVYSRLQHPNILRMFEHFEHDNWRIQSYEFIPYGDLDNFTHKTPLLYRFKSIRNFSPKKFIKFVSAQILMGLEYLHELGIIHFDLKPNNIAFGYRGYIKIFDFGLSVNEKEIKYKYDKTNLSIYGCKEKKDAVLGESIVGTGTDIFAFCIIFLEMYGCFISEKCLDKLGILRSEEHLVWLGRKKEQDDDGELKAAKLFFDLATQRTKEFVDLNKNHLKTNNMNDMFELVEGSFHFDDQKNRKSAKQLLNLYFYRDINKFDLFKQKFDLEKELNIDLRDLFLHTYYVYECMLKSSDLGTKYENPEYWCQLGDDNMNQINKI